MTTPTCSTNCRTSTAYSSHSYGTAQPDYDPTFAIAGGVSGSFVGLVLIALAMFFVRRRKRRSKLLDAEGVGNSLRGGSNTGGINEPATTGIAANDVRMDVQKARDTQVEETRYVLPTPESPAHIPQRCTCGALEKELAYRGIPEVM
ncbi:hypothetical protein NMY22_g10937 [Coprinellus aureogranulatus]|nr:hypothetical protein NMY22_g10937 [Coprinellus aureogranulatus]